MQNSLFFLTTKFTEIRNSKLKSFQNMLSRIHSIKYFVRHFLNFVIDTNLFGSFHALTQEILPNKEDLAADKDTEQRAFLIILLLHTVVLKHQHFQ